MTPPSSPPVAGPTRRTSNPVAAPIRRFLRTPKGMLTAVFLVSLAVAGTATGWRAVAPHVLAAVAAAWLTDLVLGSAVNRRVTWSSSALLSGLIVAVVLAPETSPLVTLLVGTMATVSKYLFRTARGHIFNPAALALLLSIPAFATGQSWWGAGGDLGWPFVGLMLVGGTLIVDRLNKFPLVLAFAGTYFGLFTLLSLHDPLAVAEMFRAPFVQAAVFLAMFMLTDPPTSPGRYLDQVCIGVLAAVSACVGQLLGVGQAYLLVGVLVGNVALAVRRRLAARLGDALFANAAQAKTLR